MWVKLDDDFVDHPKIVAVGPLAGWLFVAGLCYANRLLTDGFIPENQIIRLLPKASGLTRGVTKQLATKLCRVGLWKSTEVRHVKGYRVHDFFDYQPSKKQVLLERAKTRERQTRWRWKNDGENDGDLTASRRRDDTVSNGKANAAPVPVPVPHRKERDRGHSVQAILKKAETHENRSRRRFR